MKKTPTPTEVKAGALNTRNFTGKTTSTQAQYDRALEMLRRRDHNTMELRRAGIMMPAARIKELNDEHGYSIPCVARISIYDEWGFPHHKVAVYSLQREPGDEAPHLDIGVSPTLKDAAVVAQGVSE